MAYMYSKEQIEKNVKQIPPALLGMMAYMYSKEQIENSA